jgi:hypothetical protein
VAEFPPVNRTPRVSVITDWRVRDENELPDLAPGEEYERVIAPQKFVVLHRIVIRGPSLIRLRIGAVLDVPFELESEDDTRSPGSSIRDGKIAVRQYRPKELDNGRLTSQGYESIKKQLVKAGAAVAGPNAIALAPGLEVWLVLKNEGDAPVKPRAALLVQEESP